MPQRSPLIFWLLLAATIAVNAVVATWMSRSQFQYPGYVAVAGHALVLSQLGVVCIYSALRAMPFPTRVGLPLIGIVAASTASMSFAQTSEKAFSSWLGFYGLHAAMLMLCLWLLQRTRFWQNQSGVLRAWQYSMFHILLAMTIVAILLALVRDDLFFRGDRSLNIVFTGSYVVLAAASATLWILSWPWPLRLAGTLGIAILLGFSAYEVLLLTSSSAGSSGSSELLLLLVSHYLIQACMLSLWLGSGCILPTTVPEQATTAEPT